MDKRDGSEGLATKPKDRFIDDGWRLTVPKDVRDRLGWAKGTPMCVSWDGIILRVKNAHNCLGCPDVTRMGSLGKIVIPPRIREEACLYRGQIMSLSVAGDHVEVSPGRSQVRCQACGSEMDVREALPNVYLCKRCRASLERAATVAG